MIENRKKFSKNCAFSNIANFSISRFLLENQWLRGRTCFQLRLNIQRVILQDVFITGREITSGVTNSQYASSSQINQQTTGRKCDFGPDCCALCEPTRLLGQLISGVADNTFRIKLLELGYTLTNPHSTVQPSDVRMKADQPRHSLSICRSQKDVQRMNLTNVLWRAL